MSAAAAFRFQGQHVARPLISVMGATRMPSGIRGGAGRQRTRKGDMDEPALAGTGEQAPTESQLTPKALTMRPTGLGSEIDNQAL
jgi:hypothetical protein